MIAVKIKSDPYRRTIDFFTYKSSSGEWAGVNRLNSPDSKLITDNIRKNFFPYKVEEIIGHIIKEYAVQGEKIKIYFAGISDEFNELSEACASYQDIELERDDDLLENARDILPQIVDIFSKVKPIVDVSVDKEEKKAEIANNIEKFLDASNDVIPICVLGNYSSGKSTFINALIGREILPSGDMPVTAKIYQIQKADTDSDTTIEFEYDDKGIYIVISNNGFHVFGDESLDLIKNISKLLSDNTESDLSVKVNSCLAAINEEKDGVSDLIKIKISFGQGLLCKAANSFIVFDTPGSNAAMHKDHFTILEGAMKNLSNGIPIYVTEYNALDSCDNENLYNSIKEISQIDTRFTMIAVNKADLANIKESCFDDATIENILNQSVPNSLYSGGIYFVSSIMALGAKTDKKFLDEHFEEVFEDNERKYSDPESKWYKELYKYNIMPEQIKNTIVAESTAAENKIFANSGLLAIEHEILNFAEKYSAYDKCKQSKLYMDRIIEATKGEIEDARTLSEALRDQIKNELEDDKRNLIKSMESKSKEMRVDFYNAYDQKMKECYESEDFTFDKEEMQSIEKKILDKRRAANDLDGRWSDVKESGSSIFDNFGKPIDEFVKGVVQDFNDTLDDLHDLREAKFKADREAADELLKTITDNFTIRGDSATEHIDYVSRKYWEDNTDQVKKELSLIVAESATLDDEKKRELETIIIEYDKVKFTEGHVFERANFERKLYFMGHEIDLNRLNTRKLADTYNKDYDSAVKKVAKEIKGSHNASFEAWTTQLVGKIIDNIVDYSPKLSEQSRQVAKEDDKIVKLTETIEKLTRYTNQIEGLISWK